MSYQSCNCSKCEGLRRPVAERTRRHHAESDRRRALEHLEQTSNNPGPSSQANNPTQPMGTMVQGTLFLELA